mgnify:CR=1 FL=1
MIINAASIAAFEGGRHAQAFPSFGSERTGAPAPDISVGVRSGDTPPNRRRELITKPPDILITTPESLFLMLTSAARETLASVQTVIIDMGELEFLSSGCFKCLCTWARLLLERDASYRLHIYSNPKYYWQVRSLNALRMLAPDHISVEQRGSGT